MNDKELLPLLERLIEEQGNTKKLSYFHLDGHVLNASKEEKNPLMLAAACCFVNSPTKSGRSMS